MAGTIRGSRSHMRSESKVRAAGSMNTTISDFSKFTAALVSGDGLSRASFAQMTGPQLHIAIAHQFPLFQPDLPVNEQRKDLYAGLGVVVFDGPQGHGFYKGGHDGQTANTMVCIKASQRCVLILSNDVRSEAGFAELVGYILGDTGVPYHWEYGTRRKVLSLQSPSLELGATRSLKLYKDRYGETACRHLGDKPVNEMVRCLIRLPGQVDRGG